ncbi:hypothetical protein M0657_004647 [Pyricularia oryzae]|uniref:Uncharacterized protein n=2 Tax=Pyricularia oryzae TaxID=318829 RepID=A0A4P7N729_PYROR|nr:hypothetical protein M0657_004647 [Pyricularia oryzae]KAI7926222.1 hypothetical protein M9X92_002812 [Pyricularia oryzae]QBZ57001.1 hypothetical protein PoMZ_01920 [Pyricularia oryzae]
MRQEIWYRVLKRKSTNKLQTKLPKGAELRRQANTTTSFLVDQHTWCCKVGGQVGGDGNNNFAVRLKGGPTWSRPYPLMELGST